ncbi:UDP-N-acetylglucosamine pyrophosphorylase [Halogeometricum pallidum JCM 14848]|uniref:UDP-N-acetylglucosamine pyrophosphorylase n=1 Tax=Halogeometricum pallidum JCM 14848 TaxID=1227487 RepID=M0D920_HALPD|nr:nucleotidyltransferase family protein [Halogeometricum pallidum]ELZ31323.1 UDP-N-acetylglucosamine pyrophosphorylase [Halogeometricum pallidum JCM 14848]
MSDTDPIGGVVLAAGRSTRFGEANKLLEPLRGTPLVSHTANTAVDSALDEVAVVVGHESEAVVDAVSSFDLPTRYNEAYSQGQSTSVRTGVEFAREAGWEAAVFLLGDMPFVRPGTVDRLLAAYRAGDGSIVAPRYDGKRGNPVLFDRRHFDALADVDGDRGGRELVMEHDGTRFVDVDDPGVLRDIDSEADLRTYANDAE